MTGEVTDDTDELTKLLQRAASGDERAVQELFARYRDRLRRMVRLRLSRRVQGRVDDSDVLQETFLDVARRLQEYTADPKLPFYLWLRHMTGLKLAEIHRRHLGTQLRDADREVTLHRGGLPEADSVSLAAHLLVNSPLLPRPPSRQRRGSWCRKPSTAWTRWTAKCWP